MKTLEESTVDELRFDPSTQLVTAEVGNEKYAFESGRILINETTRLRKLTPSGKQKRTVAGQSILRRAPVEWALIALLAGLAVLAFSDKMTAHSGFESKLQTYFTLEEALLDLQITYVSLINIIL